MQKLKKKPSLASPEPNVQHYRLKSLSSPCNERKKKQTKKKQRRKKFRSRKTTLIKH